LKIVVNDGFTSNGTNGLAVATTAINAQANNSKYVQMITALPATGESTIRFIAATTGLPGAATLMSTPGSKPAQVCQRGSPMAVGYRRLGLLERGPGQALATMTASTVGTEPIATRRASGAEHGIAM